MRLHYRVHGEGRSLVILHGLLGSSDNWQSMAKRLAAHRRVYSLDLRNHGQSPHAPAMGYDVMAEDVLEFLDEYELREPAVLGHSMGGKVAMQLATRHSENIDKLLIVDIAPKSYPPTHRALLTAMEEFDLRDYTSFGELDRALSSTIADPVVRQLVLKNLTRDDSGEFRWRIGLDEISQNYDALTEELFIATPFSKPACFIRGELSNFIKETDRPTIREAFPRAEFVTIPGAGHWVHVDAADAFYAAAAKFLVD